MCKVKYVWIPASLPTIYEARENFRQEGIEGLLPEKRGPKKPRKLKPEVRRYLEELVGSEPDLKAVIGPKSPKTFRHRAPSTHCGKSSAKKGRQTP